MISTLDIAWLAGIVEGEGWIGVVRHHNRKNKYPIVAVQMTDKDVIEKVSRLFKTSVRSSTIPSGKVAYSFRVEGHRAAELIMTLYCLLGIRRREQGKRALLVWKSNKVSTPTYCRNGHLKTKNNIYTYLGKSTTLLMCQDCRTEANRRSNNKRRISRREERACLLLAV